MKVLYDFQNGKATRERMILVRFLHLSNKLAFRLKETHWFLSVIIKRGVFPYCAKE